MAYGRPQRARAWVLRGTTASSIAVSTGARRLATVGDGSLHILSDGKPISSIMAKGVPVTLTAQPFGPGFARLGIIEVHAKAGMTAGDAQIVAALEGGTQYIINLIVEGP